MSHLTAAQRYTIASMREAGYNQIAIAKTIGKNKSVISRELRRNSDGRTGKYKGALAQKKYAFRMRLKPKQKRFTESIEDYVVQELEKKMSPEQIAGRAKLEGIECVSHERIYQYIWADKRKKGKLYTHLRTKGKKYRKRGDYKDKRGMIKDRVDIDQRPEIVEKRERFGDFEIDTIIGANHKGAILTINDRATGIVKIRKLSGKNAEMLAEQTIKALSPWKAYVKTITADNGKEFAAHKKIAEGLNIDFYFAHPYHSWQRGSNENLNGLIRQYIPKKSNYSTFSDQYIQWVEDELNNRPRKRFNFRSPNEIIKQKVAFVT
jgi:IS30 family transposase